MTLCLACGHRAMRRRNRSMGPSMTEVRSYRSGGQKVNRAPVSTMPTLKGQGHGRGAASGGPRTPEHSPQAIARTPKLKGQSCNSPHGCEEHRENDPGGGQVAEMLQ
jgi:hypothetical protein